MGLLKLVLLIEHFHIVLYAWDTCAAQLGPFLSEGNMLTQLATVSDCHAGNACQGAGRERSLHHW